MLYIDARTDHACKRHPTRTCCTRSRRRKLKYSKYRCVLFSWPVGVMVMRAYAYTTRTACLHSGVLPAGRATPRSRKLRQGEGSTMYSTHRKRTWHQQRVLYVPATVVYIAKPRTRRMLIRGGGSVLDVGGGRQPMYVRRSCYVFRLLTTVFTPCVVVRATHEVQGCGE